MKSLVNKYGGDIVWVYRHHTLDYRYAESKKEAEASECAAIVGGEGAFWLFLDNAYLSTQSKDSLDTSLFLEFVSGLGVDGVQFEQCIENGEATRIIEQGNSEAANSGLEFTPSMVIFWPDGERRSLIIGSRNSETLEAAFDYVLGRDIDVEYTQQVVDDTGSYSK